LLTGFTVPKDARIEPWGTPGNDLIKPIFFSYCIIVRYNKKGAQYPGQIFIIADISNKQWQFFRKHYLSFLAFTFFATSKSEFIHQIIIVIITYLRLLNK
jgi:hypothetical protein